MIDEFESLARSVVDPDYSPKEPEDWDLTGFMLPYEVLVDLYDAWEKHGVMAVAGGFLDQPSQWVYDMKKLKRLYGTKLSEIRAEVAARKKPPSA